MLAGIVLLANVAVLSGGNDATTIDGTFDVALVLGAGIRQDGTPSDVLRDRLDEALVLHRRAVVSRVVVSGDRHEAVVMRRYLETRGVPSDVIVDDDRGVDTYSSVWRAKNVFGASSVVVVTQRCHLARAVFVARALGMKAHGSPADRHLYRGIAWLHGREVISRTKALFDVAVSRRPA